MAVRVQFGVFANNESKVETAAPSGSPDATFTLTDKIRLLNVNIKPGIEKHFEGTDRISPYVGAEIDFAIQSVTLIDERQVDPAGSTIGTVTKRGNNKSDDPSTVDSNRNEDGYTRIGLNLVAGADFYIFKNLYLGTEIGWGFQRQNLATISTELSGFQGAQAPKDIERGGTTTIGTNFVGAFRLGWVF